MRLLAIHRPKTPAPDDFCHGIHGEIAIAHSMCCEKPDCGCDRALVGLSSAAASTTVEVVELPFRREDVLAAVIGFLDYTGWASIIDGGAEGVREYAQELLRFAALVADDHAVGDVLRPRFNAVSESWTFTRAAL